MEKIVSQFAPYNVVLAELLQLCGGGVVIQHLHSHLPEKEGSILLLEEQGLGHQQKVAGSGEGGRRWPDSPD